MPEQFPREWYVVHTHPNAEHKAATHIQRQGFSLYLPRYLKTRRHARRVDTVVAAFFPRYLFVSKTPHERWQSLNATCGVSRLVTFGETPAVVGHRFVDALRACENACGYLPTADRVQRFEVGQPVRISSGAFAECCGLFEATTDHERVAILLDLLGRKVRVQLDIHAVEAA
jgi:transcriptional antiterminator RfaH